MVICDEDKVNEESKYEGVPTLIIEVLSPSTRDKDMAAKLNLYLKSGVAEYWVVDLERKKVFQYTFTAERDLDELNIFSEDEAIRSAHFTGLEINLKEIL